MLTKGAKPLFDLGWLNFPFDELTIGAFGSIILFVVSTAMSFLTAKEPADRTREAEAGTLWHWLRTRHARAARSAV